MMSIKGQSDRALCAIDLHSYQCEQRLFAFHRYKNVQSVNCDLQVGNASILVTKLL